MKINTIKCQSWEFFVFCNRFETTFCSKRTVEVIIMLFPILIKVIQRFVIPVITRGDQTLVVLHAAIVALTNGTQKRYHYGKEVSVILSWKLELWALLCNFRVGPTSSTRGEWTFDKLAKLERFKIPCYKWRVKDYWEGCWI